MRNRHEARVVAGDQSESRHGHAAVDTAAGRTLACWRGGGRLTDYLFDNRAPEAQQRFGGLEAAYDPVTIRHLEPFVVAGSRCLEVGGGGGSIASWMSERVGEHGRVVVTDLNTRFLERLAAPNVEVRQHDIVSDPLEEAAFDVVHTRLVLLHIPERERVIARLIAALKPGGWLVLQEFDAVTTRADPTKFESEHLLKTLTAVQDLLTDRGADIRFGRRLFPLLEAAGLNSVEAEGHLMFLRGGSAGASVQRANFEQMHDAMIAAGLREQEYQQDLARLDDDSVIWPSQILWTVRGRKP